MVDLRLPRPTDALDEAPRERVQPGEISRAYNAFGSGLQNLSSGIEDAGAEIAKKKGAEDAQKLITRNEDGSISVGTPNTSFRFGKIGHAYADAVDTGIAANLQTKMTADLTLIRQKFRDDPDGFRTAAGSYVDDISGKFGPTLAPGIARTGNTLATQHFDGLVNEKGQRDITMSAQAITTQLDDLRNQQAALARQSGTESETFKKNAVAMGGLYDKLASNRLFGFTPEKIESEKKRTNDTMRGEAVVGEVDRTFTKKGKIEASRILKDEILNNPSSTLSDTDRTRLYNMGIARLEALTSDQKAAIDANKENVKQLWDASTSGKKLAPEVYDAARDHAISIGDHEGVQKIEAARQAQEWGHATSGLTEEQRFNSGGIRSGAMPVGGFDQAMARTFKEEGGLNARDTNGTPSNFGVNQAANPDVDVKSLSKDQAKEIYRKRYWNAIGGDYLPPELAHVAFDTAVIAGPQMAKDMLNKAGGDPAKFMDLREQFLGRLLAKDPEKYGKYANAWANRNANLRADVGAAPSAGGGMPFSRDAVAQNPWLLSAYVKSMASDASTRATLASSIASSVEQGIKAGIAPNAETLANLYQLGTSQPEKYGAQLERITAQIIGGNMAERTNGVPPAMGQTLVDQAKAMAQGSSILQGQIATAYKEQSDKMSTQLREDPHNEAARRGWIPQAPIPLNMTDPSALALGIQQRAMAATAIGSRTGDRTQSIFAPKELDMAKDTMTNGSLDSRTNLLSAITQHGIPEPVIKATLAELAKNDETKGLAIAGWVARFSPQAAKDVIDGQAILKQDQKFGPGKTETTTFLKALPPTDMPNSEARAAIGEAAKAVYAKMSYAAGDATNVLNEDRYKKALNSVTGGIIDYRGSKVMAPWYGAAPREMSNAIQSLTDKDLAGAWIDGAPFPKEILNSRSITTSGPFRLESVGEGKYVIFSGTDQARRYVQRTILDARDPAGPFVLDLGRFKGMPVPDVNVNLPSPVLAPINTGKLPGKATTLPVSPEMGQTGTFDSFKP